ncbi:MAG: diguanylate cyclase [Lachnospiraceae bacterium]|nr:diguanylate cyclase [Lachnospiraceae bacterium]
MQEYVKDRILIVDDEKVNLDALNHILKNEYTVYVAKTGAMAIARAEQDKPDLILLDIVLPDMSGYDVLKELKENINTKAIPIIFITELNNVSDQERGFLLGAADFITKPFSNAIIKARVRTHLKSAKQMRTIEQLCTMDPLTEIANKSQFDEFLAAEWEKAVRDNKPISILNIDLDLFKQYNDTYGYLQGDVLLQSLVQVLVAHIRPEIDLAARIGGEEFAVILLDTDLTAATVMAEEICLAASIKEIPSMGYSATQMTVSIGVAVKTPNADDDIREFLEEADRKLKKAKSFGRNQVCTSLE